MQLVAVLREVKYLLIRNMEEIPVSASQLYANNDTLLMYVAHLDLTVAWYNKIRETVLEVEYPIIERQLQAIDEQLLQAEQTLDWQSDGKLTATVVNGAGTTGEGRCFPPRLQVAVHGGRGTVGQTRNWPKCTAITKALNKTTNCRRGAKKSGGVRQPQFSGASRRTRASSPTFKFFPAPLAVVVCFFVVMYRLARKKVEPLSHLCGTDAVPCGFTTLGEPYETINTGWPKTGHYQQND